MKTLEIPVKFQNGDTVYTTKQTKVELVCHVCEGVGKIKYNDKDMKCPECMGAGKFKSDKNVHVVIDEPLIVRSTKISISSGDISIKYKVGSKSNDYNRSEENLFSTREEAQARCEELNKEKIYVSIDNIIIQDSFKETAPSLSKIQSKLDYYKTYKKFEKDIVVGNGNVLQDGYINYLICKLLNIRVVKAVVE